jgi:hypothetical protein
MRRFHEELPDSCIDSCSFLLLDGQQCMLSHLHGRSQRFRFCCGQFFEVDLHSLLLPAASGIRCRPADRPLQEMVRNQEHA